MARETIEVSSIRSIKIDIAQEQFVRPRIGDKLFDYLLEPKYAEFVSQYLKPALAHYVRAAIIDELSIQITDSGAILYQSSSKDSTQDSRVDTSLQDIEESRTTQLASDSIDTTNTTVTETASQETDTDTLESVNESILSYPIGERTDTTVENTTATVTTKDSVVGEKLDIDTLNSEKTLSQTDKSDTNSMRTTEKIVAASAAERKVIVMRAYSDAKVLMAKAIRFIERNLDEFPEYEPLNFSQRVFF